VSHISLLFSYSRLHRFRVQVRRVLVLAVDAPPA
jgi:hypothetical protein